jgi:glycogen operon protein
LLVHLIFNAYQEALEFELPPDGAWHRWIDTFLDSPNDIVPWRSAPPVGGGTYRAQPRSVVVLYTNAGEGVGTPDKEIDRR